MRDITEIIIHCSATKERNNFKLNDIEGWHKQRGFPLSGGTYCGYHYVIGLDGTIEVGKDIKAIGCHCKGHNANSIGICYIGGSGCSPKRRCMVTTTLRIRIALASTFTRSLDSEH